MSSSRFVNANTGETYYIPPCAGDLWEPRPNLCPARLKIPACATCTRLANAGFGGKCLGAHGSTWRAVAEQEA